FNSVNQLAVGPEVWKTVKLTTPEREGVSRIRVLPVKFVRKPAFARDGDSSKAETPTAARTVTCLSRVITRSFPARVPAKGRGGFPPSRKLGWRSSGRTEAANGFRGGHRA